MCALVKRRSGFTREVLVCCKKWKSQRSPIGGVFFCNSKLLFYLDSPEFPASRFVPCIDRDEFARLAQAADLAVDGLEDSSVIDQWRYNRSCGAHERRL